MVFILSFINMIFDFFLFSFIWLLMAHCSHMFIITSRFSSVCPTMLVSSANICGYMSIYSSNRSVRSFVKILNSIHEMLHPYPSPLPIFTGPSGDSISRLLNINWTPCMTLLLIFILIIFSKSSWWFTMSYALAKSTKNIHVYFSGYWLFSLSTLFSTL